jgi:hypothetical protein
MSSILAHNPVLKAGYLIVCEGMGDAYLIDCLLKHNQIDNCHVGCPSNVNVGGSGKDKIPEYLALLQTASALQKIPIDGILVVGDADKSHKQAVEALKQALVIAQFPAPTNAFQIEVFQHGGRPLRVALYVIPGPGRDGTLEHLLLEAAYGKSPAKQPCVEQFLDCIGRPKDASDNEIAKMSMSALVGASCRKNPWASSALVWKDKHNPVPIDSHSFDDLLDVLRKFSAT